tara:strand:+ start:516 stop:1034 length:519 start_codon:yes stop_codon:yes gene_type:complete
MKYKLTENSIEFNNKKLYQIQALKDFGDVKAGDLGGYIEKELNLSQEGYRWLFDGAFSSNNAKVYRNGKVYYYDQVYDYDNEELYDYVKVSGDAINKLKINQEEKQEPPKHYDLTIQPIDYIIANNLNFAEGNIIKYITRYKHITRYKQKNGKEDLLKARYYLDLLIKETGE